MHSLYKRNVLSTPKYFLLLWERDIRATETVQSNTFGVSKVVSSAWSKRQNTGLERFGVEVCENGMVFFVTWVSNSFVQMIKTVHKVGPDQTVERIRRRPKLTSTNGRHVRIVFGDSAT